MTRLVQYTPDVVAVDSRKASWSNRVSECRSIASSQFRMLSAEQMDCSVRQFNAPDRIDYWDIHSHFKRGCVALLVKAVLTDSVTNVFIHHLCKDINQTVALCLHHWCSPYYGEDDPWWSKMDTSLQMKPQLNFHHKCNTVVSLLPVCFGKFKLAIAIRKESPLPWCMEIFGTRSWQY